MARLDAFRTEATAPRCSPPVRRFIPGAAWRIAIGARARPSQRSRRDPASGIVNAERPTDESQVLRRRCVQEPRNARTRILGCVPSHTSSNEGASSFRDRVAGRADAPRRRAPAHGNRAYPAPGRRSDDGSPLRHRDAGAHRPPRRGVLVADHGLSWTLATAWLRCLRRSGSQRPRHHSNPGVSATDSAGRGIRSTGSIVQRSCQGAGGGQLLQCSILERHRSAERDLLHG